MSPETTLDSFYKEIKELLMRTEGRWAIIQENPPAQQRLDKMIAYKNERGQVFHLWISGSSGDAIERYTRELHVELEVLPDIPMPTSGFDQPAPKDKSEQTEAPKTPPTPGDLIITINPIDTRGIEAPYIIKFFIDPTVGNGASHDYSFVDANWAAETVTVTQDSVRAILCQDYATARTADVSQAGNSSADLYPVGGLTTWICMRVTGTGNNNKYAISGVIHKDGSSSYDGPGRQCLCS
jgi:hypothetical protein